MRNTIVKSCGALLTAVCLSLAMSACGSDSDASTRDIQGQAPSSSTPEDGQAGGSPDGTNPATRQAAEQYRDCLEAGGVGADIVDGNHVVYKVEGFKGSFSTDDDHPDMQGSASSPDEDVVEQCQAEVPDYHDPDFNTK